MLVEFLTQNQIKPSQIAIGVSGGSDSLGLVLMAAEELTPLGYKIIALTVDHQLRPTSSQEAEYVAEVMHRYGIEHHIFVWNGQKPQNGVEEAARTARYELMTQWCQKNNVSILMTAHHLKDQAETFLMRLERGSGLDGLCGMRPISNRNGLMILRPLLLTDPQVLKDYLLSKKIPWVEDESNFCTDLLRVKIRSFLPLLEEQTGISAKQIAETMARLQSSQNYLEKKTTAFLKNQAKYWHERCLSFNLSDFLRLDTEIRFRVLAKAVPQISQISYPPEACKLMSLISNIEDPTFKAQTIGKCYVTICDDKLWILPEKIENQTYSAQKFKEFLQKNPSFKRLKIPAKLRRLLVKDF